MWVSTRENGMQMQTLTAMFSVEANQSHLSMTWSPRGTKFLGKMKEDKSTPGFFISRHARYSKTTLGPESTFSSYKSRAG